MSCRCVKAKVDGYQPPPSPMRATKDCEPRRFPTISMLQRSRSQWRGDSAVRLRADRLPAGWPRRRRCTCGSERPDWPHATSG